MPRPAKRNRPADRSANLQYPAARPSSRRLGLLYDREALMFKERSSLSGFQEIEIGSSIRILAVGRGCGRIDDWRMAVGRESPDDSDARIGRCQGRSAWRGTQDAVARPYPAVTCHVGVNGGPLCLRATSGRPPLHVTRRRPKSAMGGCVETNPLKGGRLATARTTDHRSIEARPGTCHSQNRA